MDVREKLVELIFEAMPPCYSYVFAAQIADHLIAHGVTITAEIEELKADNDRLRDMWARAVSELSREKARGVTVQEWISVKDRLPEKNTDVLIYNIEGYTGTDFLTKECKWFWNEEFPPTHWMPLPKPPIWI